MSWFNSADKALEIVGDVAGKGMEIWDNSSFTGQERGEMLTKLLAATKSQATSISRRHLLWFIMATTGSTLALAIMYNALGWTVRLDGLILIIDTFKIAWAFVSAVSFYYLTQFSGHTKDK